MSGEASGTAISPLRVHLFGPFDVQVEGAPMPPLRSRKGKWLLALLILHAEQDAPRAWLAGTLWPDAREAEAFHSLRQSLTDLRRALGQQAYRLRSPTTQTLRIDLAGAEVDVRDFDAAISAGKEKDLERAVALYRGSLLQSCSEEWIVAERQAREQAYLYALETLAERAIAANETAKGAEYLRRIVALDPMRESAQRQLMQVLADRGDFAAAVLAYREFRLYLHRELQIEPDAETTALYQNLRADGRHRAKVSQLPASNVVDAPVILRLPQPLSALVGREREVEELTHCLRAARLLTLTGTGGVGKTRLAIAVAEAVAEEYSDGVSFVELASLSVPELVPQAAAAVLGVQDQPGRTLCDSLLDYLRSKRLLLILDNCEHLLSACARLARHLLSGCPHLRLMATSRHILGLTGEVRWRVPSLSVPSPETWTEREGDVASRLMEFTAIQLFVERAAAARSDFKLTSRNGPAVARICRHLDGIPLALELAAARVRVLSVEQIEARLNDRFDLLTGGDLTAQHRQQTLQAMLDWSYDLLSEPERALLQRLSVFVGGWTLEAAEAVCSGSDEEKGEKKKEKESAAAPSLSPFPFSLFPGQVLDLLTSLVDKSLVLVSQTEGEARYHLLETIRQYAWERLAQTGEAELFKARHLHYFLAVLEAAPTSSDEPEYAAWRRRGKWERDNLCVALDWSVTHAQHAEAGLRLAVAMPLWWDIQGYLRERLSALLAQTEGKTAPTLRFQALLRAGWLACYHGDLIEADRLFEQGLTLGQALGDRGMMADMLLGLGDAAFRQGDFTAAYALQSRCLALREELGNATDIARTHSHLGHAALARYDYELAQRHYVESLSVYRQRGNSPEIARSLADLGYLASLQGDEAGARSLYEESLRLLQEQDDPEGIAARLWNLGNLASRYSRFDRARSLLEESLTLSRKIEEWDLVPGVLHSLSIVVVEQGDFPLARALLTERRRLLEERGGRRNMVDWLEVGARLALKQRQFVKAAQLLGAAEALREKANYSLRRLPDSQEDYERLLDAVKRALPAETFSIGWAQGRAMTLEEGVALTLDETGPVG